MNIKNFITHYTWLLVLVAIILGLVWPVLGRPFIPWLNYLLMMLMIFSVLDISLSHIIKQLKNFRRQLVIVLIVYLVSPLIVLCFRPLILPELFLGLILGSVASAGLTNIFLTRLYKGSADKALLIVAWSLFISPMAIPFLTWLFAGAIVHVNPWPMVLTILQLVFIPLIIASIIRRTKCYQSCQKIGPYFTIAFLFVIILGVIASVHQIIISNWSTALWLFVLVFSLVIINFTLGYLFGRGYEEKITYALCSSYKNFTVPVVLALTLFSPLVALPATMYGLVNNLMLVPLQLIFIPKFKPKKRHWYYLWIK